MRIYLEEDDAPLVDDRDAAGRIIDEIISNDVLTQGTFVIEGYSAARRIAPALTAARADECRRGFETPFRMRKTKPAPGALAVMAKWPTLHPLYHWITIESVSFQSYRSDRRDALISDDARIVLKGAGEIWHVSLDGQEVFGPTFQRCFNSAHKAVQQALKGLFPAEI